MTGDLVLHDAQAAFDLTPPPSPAPEPTEAQARDQALDAIEQFRAKAVALARTAADVVHAEKGRVSSTDVLNLMRQQGHGPLIDSIDARFMGAVFRNGWTRVGWERTGSHKRPVPMWSRAPKQAVDKRAAAISCIRRARTVLDDRSALLTELNAALLLLGDTTG